MDPHSTIPFPHCTYHGYYYTCTWVILTVFPSPPSSRRAGTEFVLLAVVYPWWPPLWFCCCCLFAKPWPICRRPHGLWPARPHCPRDSPGKTPGAGCLAFLQGLYPASSVSVANSNKCSHRPSGSVLRGIYSRYTFPSCGIHWAKTWSRS